MRKKGIPSMEWLMSALSQEPLILFVSIAFVVGVFIYSARKAHLNHLERMKEIDETFNPKETFHR